MAINPIPPQNTRSIARSQQQPGNAGLEITGRQVPSSGLLAVAVRDEPAKDMIAEAFAVPFKTAGGRRPPVSSKSLPAMEDRWAALVLLRIWVASVRGRCCGVFPSQAR